MNSCMRKRNLDVMRERTYVCIGFACLLVALNMLLWGGLPWTQVLGVSLLDTLQYKTVSQNAGMACGMVLLAVFSQGRSVPRYLCLIATVFTVAVADLFAVLYLAGIQGVCGPLIIVVASIGVGVSGGVLFYLWGLALSRFSERESARIILYAIMCSALCLVAVNSLAHVFQWILFSISAGLSALFYEVLSRQPHRNDQNRKAMVGSGFGSLEDPSVQSGKTSAEASLWPVLLCMAAIVFALVVMRMAVLVGLDRKADLNIVGGLCLFALAAMLLVYWFGLPGAKGGSRRIDTVSLYAMVFPLVATASVLVPVFGGWAAVFDASMLFALFVIMAGLAVTTSLGLAKRSSRPFSIVFGLCSCSMYAAIAAATFVTCLLYSAGSLDVTMVTICALVVLYVLAMAYAFVQRRLRGRMARQDNGISSSNSLRTAKVSAILADEVVRRAGMLAKRNGLTDRETEVLQQLIVGNTTRGIAEKLFVSENTVRTHLKNLYKKLDVHSKQEIIDMVDACEHA